ncbi:MAG TPA: ATP-binding protein [Gemmatimonadaceae bacterium]|nr:ATP-binding protein [Gemmatimonadaceae bacterium]
MQLLTVDIRTEQHVVLTRQRARHVAELLGFDRQDQTRLATAVSELARNAFQYAGGGRVSFSVDEDEAVGGSGGGGQALMLRVRVEDRGPGIPHLRDVLEGTYASPTGMGVGLAGVRRLSDAFDITAEPGAGTTVTFGRRLPRRTLLLTDVDGERIAAELARRAPPSPLDEAQEQNRELVAALAELASHQAEIEHLNRELDRANRELTQTNQELADTNRGVVALYAELDDKAEQLRQASELKSRFLSHVSHELRTPLSSVLNLSRLLLDRTDGELTAEQEKQIGFIRKSTQSVLELVNDLLDLAKIEAGKSDVRLTEFVAADLFGALRGMFRPLMTSNVVALLFDDASALPPLHTDEGKVSQVLRNFISNAIKFTERGEIRVSAAAGAGDVVVFSVADSGIGISPEDQQRLFAEFTQVEHALQRRVQGTGLGLALSRKLAELLGGYVTLRSTLGEGSIFSLTIPRVYGDAGEPAGGGGGGGADAGWMATSGAFPRRER